MSEINKQTQKKYGLYKLDGGKHRHHHTGPPTIMMSRDGDLLGAMHGNPNMMPGMPAPVGVMGGIFKGAEINGQPFMLPNGFPTNPNMLPGPLGLAPIEGLPLLANPAMFSDMSDSIMMSPFSPRVIASRDLSNDTDLINANATNAAGTNAAAPSYLRFKIGDFSFLIFGDLANLIIMSQSLTAKHVGPNAVKFNEGVIVPSPTRGTSRRKCVSGYLGLPGVCYNETTPANDTNYTVTSMPAGYEKYENTIGQFKFVMVGPSAHAELQQYKDAITQAPGFLQLPQNDPTRVAGNHLFQGGAANPTNANTNALFGGVAKPTGAGSIFF